MPFDGSQDPTNPPPDHEEINFVKEAFNLQYNWIAMAGACLFGIVSGSLLPIILAGGVELMYLAVVSQNWRFQRLVRSWKLGEAQKQRQVQFAEMVNSLSPEAKARYYKLAQVCASVRGNFLQLSSTSQVFLQQMDSRIDGLLHGYARLLLASSQQQQYLKSTDPNEIKREIAGLEGGMNNDAPRVQDINKKRVEILNKRVEKYQKICENQDVVNAQCSAVEDVLHLVRDQSVTMRDPQQVSDQLDNLVRDVEQTEQTVQQVEAIFGGMTPELEGMLSVGDGSPAADSSRASDPSHRTRMTN
jgi:hypothetical protein